MATYHCPKCANRIAYEAIKPTSCPKCKTNFAAAFKAVAATTAAASPTIIYVDRSVATTDLGDDEVDDVVLPPPRRVADPKRRRANSGIQYYDEEGNLEDIDSTVDTEHADPREVRRRARQLKASIKWDIRVDDADERPTRLGDIIQASPQQ